MRFYKKIKYITSPMEFGLRNLKLVSDLKSDLDSKSYDNVPISTYVTF